MIKGSSADRQCLLFLSSIFNDSLNSWLFSNNEDSRRRFPHSDVQCSARNGGRPRQTSPSIVSICSQPQCSPEDKAYAISCSQSCSRISAALHLSGRQPTLVDVLDTSSFQHLTSRTRSRESSKASTIDTTYKGDFTSNTEQ